MILSADIFNTCNTLWLSSLIFKSSFEKVKVITLKSLTYRGLICRLFVNSKGGHYSRTSLSDVFGTYYRSTSNTELCWVFEEYLHQ